ncbi:MAG: DUF1801 domain-containing protein [Bacteroidota bacterium]
MDELQIKINPAAALKFQDYPADVKEKLNHLRTLIIEVATKDPKITSMEETLKWGEPSYLVKKGSTIRIDWKEKSPEQYAMYFKCTSQLVPTFKEVFGDLFTYENTRAILFDLKEEVPEEELKACIALALNYHKVKHLPLLGYSKDSQDKTNLPGNPF